MRVKTKHEYTTYLETLAPVPDEIAQRDADVLVDNLAMTLRSIVVTEDLHRTNNLHAGCIGRNNDDTLLPIAVGVVRVTLAEHKVKRTSGIAGAADPPAGRVKVCA